MMPRYIKAYTIPKTTVKIEEGALKGILLPKQVFQEYSVGMGTRSIDLDVWLKNFEKRMKNFDCETKITETENEIKAEANCPKMKASVIINKANIETRENAVKEMEEVV
mgnify:CR=1 FL=1